MLQFRGYALELDSKHDRYERIVKISRDITIESKRIIFLLHTIDRDSKREAVLTEAKTRIDTLTSTLFKTIAQELEGQDPYQFLRAYRAGLQEFIEAVTFYYYLLDNSLPHWKALDQSFEYKIVMEAPKDENMEERMDEKMEEKSEKMEEKPEEKSEKVEEKAEETCETKEKTLRTLLPPPEYILGIADLTGELMRKCINNLATGDIASCHQTCHVVREMYKGFLSVNGIAGKEINRKLYTLKQSLGKIENVCYMIKVRGSEIPKHMLADVASSATDEYPDEGDEGYQGF